MIITPLQNKSKHRFVIACGLFLIVMFSYAAALYTVHRAIDKVILSQNTPTDNDDAAKLALIYQETKNLSQTIDARFAKEGDDIKVLESLEDMSASYLQSFEILQINPVEASPTSGGMKMLQINATAEGTWSGIISFLSSQKDFSHVHRIQKVSFVMRQGGSPADTLWNMDVIFEVPLLKPITTI
jgi:hypothetical protein